jgi:hypothetical protein
VVKPIAFVTHISEESDLARVLSRRIEEGFNGGVDVFVSSDPTNLRAGDKWFPTLAKKLSTCRIQILLLSPAAIEARWVYFEAGAAWSRKGVRQVPLCHSGLAPGHLPMPLSELQLGMLDRPESLRSLYEDLAAEAEQNVPKVDFEQLARELAKAAAALPKADDRGITPRSPHRSRSPRNRIVGYSSSQSSGPFASPSRKLARSSSSTSPAWRDARATPRLISRRRSSIYSPLAWPSRTTPRRASRLSRVRP